MRLRHIEVFQAIRQAGSVSAAAQLLHVSQPAVSKVLQHAEQQLGFALFRRVRGKLQVTPEALLLEHEMDKVSDGLDAVRRLAVSLRRQPALALRIGATPALAQALLPQVIAAWQQRHPATRCELASLHSRELVQHLLMREIDLALTLHDPQHPGLKVEPLASGELRVVAPFGYWPAQQAGRPLPVDELADAPLIGLSSSDPLASRVNQCLRGIEPPARIDVQVQTYALARAMAEAGAGLALIDPFTAHGLPAGQSRPLQPGVAVTVYALTRASEAVQHGLEELVGDFAQRARGMIAIAS
ncbi:LysR family transcriptional regulator [Pseudomonas xanthosomatis]|uniref:LysR family transcriptional regulator n=1 Tax=Pseudomonas xanthosomatis TaxID=2842356 RepID=UPI001C3DF1F6|nr:LysR substrate-binding domain-containing protein [Pseudomonas xanthosomatis]QXH45422.1 LysR family transcriptional regulator [Pseudomonas xanthosomatis]